MAFTGAHLLATAQELLQPQPPPSGVQAVAPAFTQEESAQGWQAHPVYANRLCHNRDRSGTTVRESCALLHIPHSGNMALTLPPHHIFTSDNPAYVNQVGVRFVDQKPALNKVWGIGPERKSSEAREFENLLPVSV